MARIVWGKTGSSAAFDTASAWVGGVAPGAGDTAVFDGTANADCTNPSSAVDLTTGNIERSAKYTGALGTSGSPLEVSCATLTYQGGVGSCHLLGTYDHILVRAGLNNPINIKKSGADASSVLRIAKGQVGVQGDAVVGGIFARIEVGYFTDSANDVRLDIEDGTGVISAIDLNAGRVTTARSAADMVVEGGTLRVKDAAACSNLLRASGGICNWESSGNINSFHFTGGVVDASESGESITIASVRSSIKAPARVNLNRGTDGITWGSSVYVIGNPGLELYADDYANLIYV